MQSTDFSDTTLPDEYSSFIYKSRYARFVDEKKRRENWPETVQRYFDFFDDKISKDHPDALKEYRTVRPQLERAVLNLEIMPSMRALMTAGKALERDNVAGYNPVVGTTKVLTKERGMVEIQTLEQKCATVLNVNGEWADANFHCYGEQDTYRVMMKLNSNTVNEVDCTANHRWVLLDGTVKPTSELTPGDRIKFVTAPKTVDTNSIDYRLGVIHGLVYGDGTAVHSCQRVKGYHIRLCSDADCLLKWFEQYPVSYPPSANGEPVVMMYDGFAKTHSLKELPNDDETDDYMIGFIRGWMAADGSVTKTSQVSICMGKDDKEWFVKNAPRFGYVVQREYQQPSSTNYGARKKESWVLYISRSSLTADDFIIPRKAERFKELESHYVVSNVSPTGKKERVFCAEVPDTNTFVLDKGLVTGNCSFLAVDTPRAFDEALYILCCGTGVGFSVEREYVSKLPVVAEEFEDSETTIVVADSKLGWASALKELISMLYSGRVPKWDMSRIRPAGARLKTFGGRASGPEPLNELFTYAVAVFKNAAGRKLYSIECHDLMCKIGECIVVGGVRRSALISLSNLTDERMRYAKSGQWWNEHGERALANNSVCYKEKPEIETFMREWLALVESKSGERGIFNLTAARKHASSNGRRDGSLIAGTNPCSEILLRNKQFCNLTSVMVRAEDKNDDLRRKVNLATILGTLQATLTNFRYLSKDWKRNTEEEALLGVSLTGIMDHKVLSGKHTKKELNQFMRHGDKPLFETTLADVLEGLKREAVFVNKKWAKQLGINVSAAITCLKPEGTVSQLTNTASGIHPRYSPYYIRTVRADKKDPLARFMEDRGFPVEDDIQRPHSTSVFSFPIKSPEGSVYRDDMTAIEQLEHWKLYSKHWTEQKVSCTVYVKDHEWLDVGAWVYRNFDEMTGVSFLPHTNHIYPQAPYTEVTKEVYEEALAKMPKGVNWQELELYEQEDNTIGNQTLNCTGGVCELVDLVK